jgi:hypothetical protein
MSYFANAIIENGQRYAVFPRSIGITESPDSNVVIGIASEVGWTEKDGPKWSLIIGGKAVEGLFIIAESEFVQFDRPWKEAHHVQQGRLRHGQCI